MKKIDQFRNKLKLSGLSQKQMGKKFDYILLQNCYPLRLLRLR